MQDRKRIAVCRWAFLVLCVLPTLVTIGFIAFDWLSIRSPAAKAEWERELSQRLGLAVSIKALSYPRPSVAELAAVKLSDAETGLLLAECRRVEIEPAGGKWNVTVIEPIIERRAVASLIGRLHDRVLAGKASSLRLHATQLTLREDAASDTIHSVVATLDGGAANPSARLRFSLASSEAVCEITIRRNRQITPPATRMEWTCPAPVPADLAVSFLAERFDFGPLSTVAGAGSLTWQEEQLRGEFNGEIAEIDLSRVISEHFPHRLTGEATLALKMATLENGRLKCARGTLIADGGRISRSLLSAVEEHLQLRAKLLPEDGGGVAYQRLAISFELTEEHLRLNRVGGDAMVLAAPDGSALLSVPEPHSVPAVALLRMLVPDSQVQVPATKQTAALFRWLPIPAINPPPSDQQSSHVPTRLGPASPVERSGNVIREKEVR